MTDSVPPEGDTVPTQPNALESNRSIAVPGPTAPLAGKRVKVNLYRRGIFQSCVVATCDVSSVGVNISAETPLTQGRRCLSHFELRAKDVAAMRPLTSGEADFELELELDSIEWQERVEKVPPVVAQAGRHTWRRQSVEARQKPTASPLEIGAEEGCGRLNAGAVAVSRRVPAIR
jgi:hypothetical protein